MREDDPAPCKHDENFDVAYVSLNKVNYAPELGAICPVGGGKTDADRC